MSQNLCSYWPHYYFTTNAQEVATKLIIETVSGYKVEIDDEDFDLVKGMRWCVNKSPYTFYAVARERTQKGAKRKYVLMHRVIMGAKTGEDVDHQDGNGLNNTRRNLRVCSRSQNQANRQKRLLNKTSHFKGVFWNKRHKTWYATCYCLGKQYWLGSFDNEIDAANAYNKKTFELFGEYALLNKINDVQ